MTKPKGATAEERAASAKVKHEQFVKDRERAEQVLQAKSTRLRGLRLAKEAADKEEAARLSLQKAAGRSKKR